MGHEHLICNRDTGEVERVLPADACGPVKMVERLYLHDDVELTVAADAVNVPDVLGKVFTPNQGHNAFIIRQFHAENDQVTLRGVDLGEMFAYRVVLPDTGKTHNSVRSYSVERALHHYVRSTVGDLADEKRRIPNLDFLDHQDRGKIISWDSRYRVLESELHRIGALDGIGWRTSLNLDTGRFRFEAVVGADRSNEVLLSRPDGTLISEELLITRLSPNVAYVAGQGQGLERQVITLHDDETGWDRREIMVDARDLEQDEDTTALENRGQSKLDESAPCSTFSVVPEPELADTLNLGDVVTISAPHWGITRVWRIIEISSTTRSGYTEKEVLFGQPWENVQVDDPPVE